MVPILTRLARCTGRGLALQEALYGFIMAMLFISAAAFGLITIESKGEIIALIVGMDFSWGLIDMVIFYFIDVAEQKKQLRILRNEEKLYDEKRKVLKDNLADSMIDLLDDEGVEKVIDVLCESKIESEAEIKAERKDMLMSAFASFLITFMAVIPSVVTLLIIDDLHDALMYAGIVSSICMFFIGYMMGPYLGTKKWISGTIVLGLALGITLVATFTGG